MTSEVRFCLSDELLEDPDFQKIAASYHLLKKAIAASKFVDVNSIQERENFDDAMEAVDASLLGLGGFGVYFVRRIADYHLGSVERVVGNEWERENVG